MALDTYSRQDGSLSRILASHQQQSIASRRPSPSVDEYENYDESLNFWKGGVGGVDEPTRTMSAAARDHNANSTPSVGKRNADRDGARWGPSMA